MTTMPHLPVVTDDEAGPEAKVLFAHSTRMFGRVANAVRTVAHPRNSPNPYSAFWLPPCERK